MQAEGLLYMVCKPSTCYCGAGVFARGRLCWRLLTRVAKGTSHARRGLLSLVREIEIIGEAAVKISEELKRAPATASNFSSFSTSVGRSLLRIA
jgi:hypothetical protein